MLSELLRQIIHCAQDLKICREQLSLRWKSVADGKITSAEGSGAPDILVKAAEENARQWVFGPFPARSEFPIYHVIRYIYKLDGKPKTVAYRPTIKTSLPDEIDISAVPLVSDYPPLENYKPTSTTR